MVDDQRLLDPPAGYYDSAAWRGTWEFDGGAFMNQASHYVDLLDWLIGPVESVHAYTATLARAHRGRRHRRRRDPAGAPAPSGSINVTMLTYPKNLEGSITILGEKGTVRVGGVAVNEIEHWEFADPDPDDALLDEASYQTTSVYGFGHPLYYENVIARCAGRGRARDRRPRGPAVAGAPDRHLPVGPRRQAGQRCRWSTERSRHRADPQHPRELHDRC